MSFKKTADQFLILILRHNYYEALFIQEAAKVEPKEIRNIKFAWPFAKGKH